jgi:hypothetical protein
MDRPRLSWLFVVSLLIAAPAHAAGVTVQSFSTMASFRASPFFSYVTTSLSGGASVHCAMSVTRVQQGDAAVPASSAGGPHNASVTPEITSALCGVPTVFSGATDSLTYAKQYVSIGNETGSGATPEIEVAIPPVSPAGSGAFQGYEIAVIDVGQNLVPGTGSRNSERTYFSVRSSSGGATVQVGQITNTGGDYINVILLDIDGLSGLGGAVDRVLVVDASGKNPPQKGSIDVDGVMSLAGDAPVPTLASTWGSLKALYR